MDEYDHMFVGREMTQFVLGKDLIALSSLQGLSCGIQALEGLFTPLWATENQNDYQSRTALLRGNRQL